jgi:hypothetical protein
MLSRFTSTRLTTPASTDSSSHTPARPHSGQTVNRSPATQTTAALVVAGRRATWRATPGCMIPRWGALGLAGFRVSDLGMLLELGFRYSGILQPGFQTDDADTQKVRTHAGGAH